MTDFPSDDLIESLARRVLDRTLPRSEWTHEAHFAFALWMLRHRREDAVAESFRAIITALNEAHGTPNTDSSGYHHSITIASIGAADAVLQTHDHKVPTHIVLHALMAGPYGKPDWIFTYWTRERLFAPSARREWVEPDIAPLPW